MSSLRMTIFFLILSYDRTPQGFGMTIFVLYACYSVSRSTEVPLQKRKVHMLYDIPGKAGTN